MLADTPTAVFSVFQGQYNAATAAVGMLPDVKGQLLAQVKTTLNTAIVLRNRLVRIVALAAPPVPAEDARARAAQDEEATTFDVVMPGVSILLADEIQQMQSTQQDTTVPAASSAVLTTALAADNQIMTRSTHSGRRSPRTDHPTPPQAATQTERPAPAPAARICGLAVASGVRFAG